MCVKDFNILIHREKEREALQECVEGQIDGWLQHRAIVKPHCLI